MLSVLKSQNHRNYFSIQLHHFKFPNYLFECRSFVWIAIPALSHQPGKRLRSFLWDLWPHLIIEHCLWNFGACNISIRGLSWSYFPKYNWVAEDICLLSVGFIANHLRSHPLISSDLICHVLIQCFCPSKISDFNSQMHIKKDV